MEPSIVEAIITGVATVVAAVIGFFAGRRRGGQESSSTSSTVATDTTPPRVIWTNPLDQDADVPPDIHPTAAFSKDMDPTTINPNTFELLDLMTLQQVPSLLPGGVDYDEAARVATFIPADALINGSLYEATITARVNDRAGNRLEENYTWRFRVMDY
jgi:hypothetical protein